MMSKLRHITLLVFLVIFAVSCKEKSVPRPYGYFRIDLPAESYQRFDTKIHPYSFDYNNIATINEQSLAGEKYWIDIEYPELSASIHCSYKPVKGDLFELLEDTRKIVYKHTVRADNISERPYENREQRLFGILYELSGNVASPIQFVLTDSTKHFFRGALYFETTPNSDSIAPVLQYIQRDVMHLVESFEWKKIDFY